MTSQIKSIIYFYLKVENTFIDKQIKGEEYENRKHSSNEYVEV
ncbi:hypothetical protein LOT_2131 [Lentilactobacillus otakiensis DSM 19908 = JCM 15040]|uniref:Uncharacterized protein n=1 Tax=Lentilactobacillus otakiensis DSM 19908 = JCM 15040 TaxID=1423780 RepID=S4NUG0_9LACO|nr:hypothetical protein LOT_2131 [Lentilactobacillus otakiensis DSM 19908 = JCM 15040]